MTSPDGYCARCGETPCNLIGPRGDYIGWSETVAIARRHDVASRLRNLATCLREAAIGCAGFDAGVDHASGVQHAWWYPGRNIPRPSTFCGCGRRREP